MDVWRIDGIMDSWPEAGIVDICEVDWLADTDVRSYKDYHDLLSNILDKYR